MTKVRTPLISFDAQGSLGKTLTFAGHPTGTIAERIPTHIDAKSDAQLMHRRRFINARYYWHALTLAQKNDYERAGTRAHMTGWALFLRHYLADDPRQVLWTPLDSALGSVAYDLSSLHLHGTIYGASVATGKILNCRSFDGIDDWIDLGNDSSLGMTDKLTYAAWIYPKGVNDTIIARWSGWPPGSWECQFLVHATQKLGLATRGTAPEEFIANTPLVFNTWYHVAITFEQDVGVTFYLDGIQDGFTACTGALNDINSKNGISMPAVWPNQPFWGMIDEARIFNDILSLKDIKLLALADYL